MLSELSLGRVSRDILLSSRFFFINFLPSHRCPLAVKRHVQSCNVVITSPSPASLWWRRIIRPILREKLEPLRVVTNRKRRHEREEKLPTIRRAKTHQVSLADIDSMRTSDGVSARVYFSVRFTIRPSVAMQRGRFLMLSMIVWPDMVRALRGLLGWKWEMMTEWSDLSRNTISFRFHRLSEVQKLFAKFFYGSFKELCESFWKSHFSSSFSISPQKLLQSKCWKLFMQSQLSQLFTSFSRNGWTDC